MALFTLEAGTFCDFEVTGPDEGPFEVCLLVRHEVGEEKKFDFHRKFPEMGDVRTFILDTVAVLSLLGGARLQPVDTDSYKTYKVL